MTITIKPSQVRPEPDFQISDYDAAIIKNIAIKISKIEAIKVLRWLCPGASLLASKNFVEFLLGEA